jgi:hypothetical protein
MAKGVMKSRHVWQEVQAIAESFKQSTHNHTHAQKSVTSSADHREVNTESSDLQDSHLQDSHSYSNESLKSSQNIALSRHRLDTHYGTQDLHNELIAFQKAFEQKSQPLETLSNVYQSNPLNSQNNYFASLSHPSKTTTNSYPPLINLGDSKRSNKLNVAPWNTLKHTLIQHYHYQQQQKEQQKEQHSHVSHEINTSTAIESHNHSSHTSIDYE